MRFFSYGIEPSLIVFATLALPTLANSQAVTYDFAGVVTSATGIYASAGPTISGTFTIDFGAANPAQSGGTVGSSTNSWDSNDYGGETYSLAVPNSLLFASSLSTGGVTYAVTTPSIFGSYSEVAGVPSPFPFETSTYHAADTEFSSNGGDYVQSLITLQDTQTYSASGLPVFTSSTLAYGYLLSSGTDAQLDYTINSLTPATMSAPEIDPASAASGLSFLLGGLLVLRGRRSKDQHGMGKVLTGF
jgi:hypothetical protein